MAEYKLPRLSDQDAVMAGLMEAQSPTEAALLELRALPSDASLIDRYVSNDVIERNNVFPVGLYSDGVVRPAWPELSGLPGFERAQHQLDAEGIPGPDDQEAIERLAIDGLGASGGAVTGGLALTALGRGVPENAVGAFGGRLFGRGKVDQSPVKPQSPAATLKTLDDQIAEARQVLDASRPGTPSTAVAGRSGYDPNVPIQRQIDNRELILGQLQKQIDAEQARRATLPKHTSAVQGARDVVDRSAERAMLLEQFESAPSAGRPFKNRQGAMSMAEQRKALNKQLEKNSPDDVLGTPSPWDPTGKFRVGKGGRPLSFEDAIQAQVNAEKAASAAKKTKALVAQKSKKLETAKNASEVNRLKAEIKAANERAAREQKEAKFYKDLVEKFKNNFFPKGDD